jgi:hypothetical protein
MARRRRRRRRGDSRAGPLAPLNAQRRDDAENTPKKMYLCSDLIISAFRKISVLAAGETPNSDEYADALASLNVMLESWSAEQIAVYQIVNSPQPLVATQQTYTMGIGGNFSVPRPLKIESAGIITPDLLRHEMKIVGALDWAKIEEKALTGKLPKVLYNDNAYPLLNLNVWPIPNATGGAPTLDLYVWAQLQQFATVGDTFSMPPAYFRALVYNLGLELAPEYGSQAQAAAAGIAGIAASSKNDVVTLNASNAIAQEPSALPPSAPVPAQGQ